ncbi:MAG: hypothetical protein EXQ86_08340 [Rhodospirillales bacterium]|nr:hypothetical protein [Rhodospirillales bacterium]
MDVARGNGEAIQDVDRDALHILPLAMIPIETPGLKRTRIIKNSRLEGVVELYEGKGTGSGQVQVKALDLTFRDISEDDLTILGKLATLPTYDVYSLRILLREHDIPIKDHGYLQLSKRKQGELEGLMKKFTRPLITHVYGDNSEIRSYVDAVAMFRHPDVTKARENLQKIAGKLGIKLHEVPRFLEDYGDIFMSVSYYQDCLSQIDPALEEFQRSVKDIRANRQLQDDRSRLNACIRIGATFDKLRTLMASRFATFNSGSKAMWTNVDSASFQRFRTLVQHSHVAIGGILCALNVKMGAWQQKFPGRDGGGVMNRADFLITEMQQGMDEVVQLSRPKGPPAAVA